MFSEVNQLSGKQTLEAQCSQMHPLLTPQSPTVPFHWNSMRQSALRPCVRRSLKAIARWLLQLHLGCRLTIIILLGMHDDQSLKMVYQFYGGCVETSSPAKLVFVLIKHYFAK